MPTVLVRAVGLPVMLLDPQSQIETTRSVTAQSAPAATLAAFRQWEGTAWAMRGAWDSALVAFDRLYADQAALPFAGVRFAAATMAYWTGALDRDAATARRREVADYGGPEAAVASATRLLGFLDGIIAYADQDSAGMDSARATLRTLTDDEAAVWLDGALAAFQLDLAGNRQQAADSLLAIERQRGGGLVFDYYPVPFIRLAAGRMMADAGRAASADSLLSYYETGVATPSAQMVLKQSAALAAFERARAWDRAGDANRAVRFYREFLRMYDMPPERHRQYIDEAESSLARLTGSAERR